MKYVKKGWGSELWIHNSPEYCGKLMKFDANKRCSLHFHKKKSETFFLQSGKMVVSYAPIEDIVLAMCSDHKGTIQQAIDSKLKLVTLNAGDSFEVPRYLVHQMLALTDCELFEFSTEHDDDDSYRIVRGD